jgi:PAS domain S-box-containing protein
MTDGPSPHQATVSDGKSTPRRAMRFIWQTDSQGHFHFPDVNEAIADLFRTVSGKKWPQHDEVSAALARQQTFVGVTSTLSFDGLSEAKLTFSGTPVTGADGGFEGYRGFGSIKPSTKAVPTDVIPTPLKAAPVPMREVEKPAIGRSDAPWSPTNGLSESERNAFREIARALGAPSTEPKPVQEPEQRPERIPEAVPTLSPVIQTDHEVEIETGLLAPTSNREESQPSGDRLAEVMDRLPIGILISRSGVPILMNRTLLDWLGYSDADEFFDIGGVDTLFGGRDLSRRSVDDEGAMLVRRRDGDMMALGVKLQTLQWEGLPASLMIFDRQSDEDGESYFFEEEAPRQSEGVSADDLSSILDTATDGVLVLDQNGRILSMNRSAEALFGADTSEVEGERFTALLAEVSRNRAADYLDGLKDNGVASVLNDGREVIGETRHGGHIPLFMTMGRIGTPAEPKFCAVLRDITTFKRAERDFIEARRAAETASARKSDFLSRISHEIRTPLSAIIGFAELMHDERFGEMGNSRYRSYVADILKSGRHVLDLVNDLLDLSKIEAGRTELTFVEVDLNALLLETLNTINETAKKGHILVRSSLASDLPPVVADGRSLTQIMLNLMSNAIKFTPEGGQVIVSTARTQTGEVVIRVKDTGIGMTEADIVTALEPFRQLTTTRRAGGTGLGLPLTKALIEANRASMSIKSARHEGTMVEIVFPPTRVLADR